MTVPDLPLFNGMDDGERRRLVAACTPRRFGAREVVFHRGDPGDSLHVVVSGRLVARVATPLGHSAPVTQDDLAGMAGTTRATTNVVLRMLETVVSWRCAGAGSPWSTGLPWNARRDRPP